MGKINVYYDIMIENQKRRENVEIKNIFYINLNLIDGIKMEFTAC